MNWPKELDDEYKYDDIKKIISQIESDEWFKSVEVIWNSKYDDYRRKVYYVTGLRVASKDDVYYYLDYNYSNDAELYMHYYKISGTGKTIVNKRAVLNITNEKFLYELKTYITSHRQAIAHQQKNRAKDQQMQALSSIIIDGIAARYPKVNTALAACHRGSKNFLSHEFRKGKLIINAKLTIEDKNKLDKLFQVLEEIV